MTSRPFAFLLLCALVLAPTACGDSPVGPTPDAEFTDVSPLDASLPSANATANTSFCSSSLGASPKTFGLQEFYFLSMSNGSRQAIVQELERSPRAQRLEVSVAPWLNVSSVSASTMARLVPLANAVRARNGSLVIHPEYHTDVTSSNTLSRVQSRITTRTNQVLTALVPSRNAALPQGLSLVITLGLEDNLTWSETQTLLKNVAAAIPAQHRSRVRFRWNPNPDPRYASTHRSFDDLGRGCNVAVSKGTDQWNVALETEWHGPLSNSLRGTSLDVWAWSNDGIYVYDDRAGSGEAASGTPNADTYKNATKPALSSLQKSVAAASNGTYLLWRPATNLWTRKKTGNVVSFVKPANIQGRKESPSDIISNYERPVMAAWFK